MNKKLIVFLSVLSMSLSNTSAPAKADTANPPVVTGFTQLTQGPYKPGDMIQFKIEYSGGNPGISDYWILFDSRCIAIKDQSPQYHWSKSNGGEENQFFGNGLFTGFIQDCLPGKYGVSKIQIKDKTGLLSKNAYKVNFGNDADKFEIADYEFKSIPIGTEIPTSKLPDELNLIDIPKNPLVGSTYSLPEKTTVGFPVSYRVNNINNSACKITKDGFNGYTPFFGGTLSFIKTGSCQIYIGRLESTSSRSRYDLPSLKANVQNLSGMILFNTTKANSTSTIKCIKGKTTKAVTGINPKCPTGYKIKA